MLLNVYVWFALKHFIGHFEASNLWHKVDFSEVVLKCAFPGPLLALYWPFPGPLLALCLPFAGPLLALCWPFSDPLLALCWPFSGPLLALRWPFAGHNSRVFCHFYIANLKNLSWLQTFQSPQSGHTKRLDLPRGLTKSYFYLPVLFPERTF